MPQGTHPLPPSLGPFGAPGFELLVAPDMILDPTPPTGSHHAEVAFAVPNDPLLAGTTLYARWLVRDPAANALGHVLTRACLFHITR